MTKKVFVSGCFDVLHSGHIRFLEEAAELGDVYVSIGSDATVQKLKNRSTLYTENERKYMLESIKFVKQVFIGPDDGILDFASLLDQVKPDIFFVNSDGDSDIKRQFVESKGIEYKISQRKPKGDLPVRSTTSIRQTIQK
ncbi:MAG: adenylyltransferase/cytidyltransferase family protein [Alphaproteobacteria bacterium]|nr:adenylyltransferase/cytidyltransferase family protein [Alphaproteobacteria bacterium]